MHSKLRPYIALVAAAIVVAALFFQPEPQKAEPVVAVLPTPPPVVETVVPATPTPTPTPPPAITPPADNAASGSDIVLQPVAPATDSDLPLIEEAPVAEESPGATEPVATT